MKKLKRKWTFLTVKFLMQIKNIFYGDMKILMIKKYLQKIILKLFSWKAK